MVGEERVEVERVVWREGWWVERQGFRKQGWRDVGK